MIETCSISSSSHECNYGLEMLICGGTFLRGAEGVISTHSCLKPWQIWPMHAVEVDMMLMDLPTIPFSMHQSWHGNHGTITQFSPHLARFFMSRKLHLPFKVVICFILESTLRWLFWMFCNIQKALKMILQDKNCPVSHVLYLLFLFPLNCDFVSTSMCFIFSVFVCVHVRVNKG